MIEQDTQSSPAASPCRPLHYTALILNPKCYTHTHALHTLTLPSPYIIHTLIYPTCYTHPNTTSPTYNTHPYTTYSHTLCTSLHYTQPYTTHNLTLHAPIIYYIHPYTTHTTVTHTHTPLACCTHILSYFLRVHWLCPSSETLASLELAAKDHMIWSGSQKLLMVFEGSATACFILFCV